MTTETTIPLVALLLSVASSALSLWAALAKRSRLRAEARSALGQQYAQLAVASAEQLGGSPDLRLAAALDAFRLIDTTLDGKRDFTDAQARILIESAVAAMK